MTRNASLLFTTALACASVALPAFAADEKPAGYETLSKFGQALVGGTPYIDARYRFEHVDQSGVAENAEASTLRTLLGYKTGEFYGFSVLGEVEDVTPLGAENYNSGSNGHTNFPTVADPDGTELNQAYLQYNGFDSVIRYGRQNIKRGNVRFIGDVGWRQNNQTHDGVSIVNKSLPDTEIFYGYSYNINRIFGEDDLQNRGDFNGNVHMVDVSYSGLPYGTATAYGYLLDLENGASVSSETYGLRFEGKQEVASGVHFLYDVEYARQSDYGDNPTSYDADYYRIEPGVSYSGVTLKAGYELLGSDNGGAIAFSTPLATLHKFNGWADIFLSTPANGLEDVYASASYSLKDTGYSWLDGLSLTAVYHDFSSDTGSINYGQEWDFDVVKPFYDHYTAGVKYAHYEAENNGFGVDTEKVIFSLGMNY